MGHDLVVINRRGVKEWVMSIGFNHKGSEYGGPLQMHGKSSEKVAEIANDAILAILGLKQTEFSRYESELVDYMKLMQYVIEVAKKYPGWVWFTDYYDYDYETTWPSYFKRDEEGSDDREIDS